MANTKEIQKFYHRLFDLKDQGFDITIEDNCYKNYVAYFIGKNNGNAEYKDCIIMYNGDQDSEETENICSPDDIPVIELLDEIDEIVQKIKSIFGK